MCELLWSLSIDSRATIEDDSMARQMASGGHLPSFSHNCSSRQSRFGQRGWRDGGDLGRAKIGSRGVREPPDPSKDGYGDSTKSQRTKEDDFDMVALPDSDGVSVCARASCARDLKLA